MKVLNVQPFDYFGSIQLRSLMVAKRLRKYGIETIFVVPYRNEGEALNSFSDVAAKSGFKIYQTRCVRPLFITNLRSLFRLIKLLLYFPLGMLDLYKLSALEHVDAIQINGFVCIQEALFASFLYSKKRYWVLISDLYPRLAIRALSFVIKRFDRIFVSRKLIGYYFGTINDTIIYEPVDNTFFDPTLVSAQDKESIKKKFSLVNSSPLLVTIAMVSPQKGLEYLLQSIHTLKGSLPNIKLVVIGGVIPTQKEYYATLRNMAADLDVNSNVLFTNYIPQTDLRTLLSIADVFVLASVHEGTPVSILEAMSMEKAVIATNVGGISEQVVQDKTGLLVRSKDPIALADAIFFLLQNTNKRVEIGVNARLRVKALFSFQTCVSQYRRLFE